MLILLLKPKKLVAFYPNDIEDDFASEFFLFTKYSLYIPAPNSAVAMVTFMLDHKLTNVFPNV